MQHKLEPATTEVLGSRMGQAILLIVSGVALQRGQWEEVNTTKDGQLEGVKEVLGEAKYSPLM